MPKTEDRIKETTTTTGTGTITLLGASSQYQSFSSFFSVGDSIMYAIVGQGTTEYEVGLGTLTGASTLSRDTVEASSNSNALVNFSAGTKDVFATFTGNQAARSNIGRQIMFQKQIWPQNF